MAHHYFRKNGAESRIRCGAGEKISGRPPVIAYRLQTAKKPETKSERVRLLIDMPARAGVVSLIDAAFPMVPLCQELPSSCGERGSSIRVCGLATHAIRFEGATLSVTT